MHVSRPGSQVNQLETYSLTVLDLKMQPIPRGESTKKP
jgi:hypothetical protein